MDSLSEWKVVKEKHHSEGGMTYGVYGTCKKTVFGQEIF